MTTPSETPARTSRFSMRVMAPALMAAFVLGVHSASLEGPGYLTSHHDNLDGAAPLRVEVARQWLEGHVPLWNPYKRAGMPLLADTTAATLNAGNLPFLLAAAADASLDPDGSTAAGSGGEGDGAEGPRLSPFAALDAVAALHALLGALFLYAFLRETGVAPLAAAVGGLVFGCGGTTTWFAAWYVQIQNSIVFLPLVLLGLHRAATQADRFATSVAVGAAGVALQWFAGYPETSVYSGLISAGYAASLVGAGRGLAPLVALACVYGAGLALAAVQLVPALELQSLSRRPAAMTLEWFQSLPASASMLEAWALPATVPDLAFPPAAAYHVGLPALVLAASALVLTPRSRLTGFLAVVLAVGFLLSLGAATPLSAWAWHLPGLSAFRHPFKHMFEVVFALSALAAVGGQALLDRAGPRRLEVKLALFAALSLTATSLRVNHSSLVAGNPAPGDTSGARPPLLSTVCEDGCDWSGPRVLVPRPLRLPRDPLYLTGDYPSQFRVPALHGAGPFLWADLAGATGMVEEESSLRRGLLDAGDRTLDVLGCGWMVQSRPTPPPMEDGRPRLTSEGFQPPVDEELWGPVRQKDDARLVERSRTLPRLRFVAEVRCADAGTVEASLRSGTPDPAAFALVVCAGDARPARVTTAPDQARVSVAAERAGRLELLAEVPEDGSAFLVVSQADLPGWRATVDGRDTRVWRVHGLVQGIEVPGGTSRVVLDYRPRTFTAGASLSAAALVTLLAGSAMQRRRRRAAA